MTDVEVATRMVAKARKAQERGIPFEMSFKQYKKLLLQEKCAYTGEVLTDKEGSPTPNQRSLDRMDASIGYTDANTVVCTHAFNVMKNNLTVEATKAIVRVFKRKKLM